MKGEQEHGEDVERGDDHVLKPVNHHGVNVITVQRVRLEQEETRIRHPHREMGKVVEDERENKETARRHRAGSKGGFDVLFFCVSNRPGAAVIDGQTNRVINVQHDRDEEENAERPEQRSKRTQMLRVAVDPVRTEKDLQVAEQMSDNESNQDQPCDRDDELLPD